MPIIDIDMASEFPGSIGGPYLDTAARCLLPRSAHAAMLASLDSVLMGRANKDAMFATVERARERFARLINAEANEIAITKNISEGLNIIAAALPWRARPLPRRFSASNMRKRDSTTTVTASSPPTT